MSSSRVNQSYNKIEDIGAFPEDFFSTLNLSNIRNGPRVSKSIYKQIKNNNKSLSRVWKRERSLDVEGSYIFTSPDERFKPTEIKFPSISKSRVGQEINNDNENINTIDSNYQINSSARRQISQRKLNRYMRSEDRFRRTKMMLGNSSIFGTAWK